jgi:hypothetical protein
MAVVELRFDIVDVEGQPGRVHFSQSVRNIPEKLAEGEEPTAAHLLGHEISIMALRMAMEKAEAVGQPSRNGGSRGHN